jgi:hypothetical protein
MKTMREAMLLGTLEYPGSTVFEKFPEHTHAINAFWSAIWGNYLRGDETNGLKWYGELGCSCYNYVVRSLDIAGWLASSSLPGRKWASVKLLDDNLLGAVSPDELQEIKAEYMYDRYLLECNASSACMLVRQNGKTRRTGLVREGFRDAGNTQFGYDMEALQVHEEAVKLNLTKSMDKIRKDYPDMKSTSSTYDQVSVGIYDWHYRHHNRTFTTGDSISDSRGRAISSALRKVANPIGNKDFRSALVITYAGSNA